MEILLFVTLILTFILPVVTIAAIYKIVKLKNIKYKQPAFLKNKRSLIVYYSNGQNTKNIANKLNFVVGGDIEEIKLQKEYPSNVFKMSKEIRAQIKQGILPEVNNVDISDYDVIFIGSPIWSFSLSLPIKSFLKNNDFENKILIPFFTYSGGACKKKLFEEIKNLANCASVQKPLFAFENGIFLVKEQLINWLNKMD